MSIVKSNQTHARQGKGRVLSLLSLKFLSLSLPSPQITLENYLFSFGLFSHPSKVQIIFTSYHEFNCDVVFNNGKKLYIDILLL